MSNLPSGTVTFLFTDVQDSTPLWDQHPAAMRQALKRHDEIIETISLKHNGALVRPRGEGDSRFVVFERAIDGVSATAAIQRTFHAEPWPGQITMQVRIAVHTGEGEFRDGDYYGSAVNRCARLRGIAHGGQSILSQTTFGLVRDSLPERVELHNLGEHPLKGLKHPEHIYQIIAPGLPTEFPPLKSPDDVEDPPAPGKPPFKGLQHFDEADAGLFFGRELLITKIIDRLSETIYPDRQPRDETKAGSFLALIVGASGSGKSSLVRAGLIPALKLGEPLADGSLPPKGSQDWPVHIITPGAHPLESLAISLTRGTESMTATATLMDDMKDDARSLHLAVCHILGTDKPGQRLLVVVDQFEELFTLCRDETERKAFIDNLLTAAEHNTAGPTIVVIVMRADFYAHCSQYANLRQALAHSQEYIGAMTTDELRRAVEEPARLGEWEFEPGLVDLLLQEVGDEPGALPLLSHALLETWKQRRGRTMTFTGYTESGGVRGAIAKTAERVFWRLSPEEQTIARNLFLRLTELGEGTDEGGTPSPDTRRRVSLTELLPDSTELSEHRAATESVLQTLVEARLITTAEETAEVAHEALIREWPTLREWLNEDREGLRLHRRLTLSAADWEEAERASGFLLRGSRLDQFEQWAGSTDLALTEVEQDYLDASLAERRVRETTEEKRQARETALEQRSRRFLRALVGVLTVATVIALILTSIAFNQQRIAKENALLAGQNAATATVAQGQALIEAATAVAAQEDALQEKQKAQEQEALTEQYALEALEAYSESLSVHARQALQSKDSEKALALAIAAANVIEQPPDHVQQTLVDLAFAPGPRHLYNIVDISESRPRFALSVAFSPDGQIALVGLINGSVILVNLESGTVIHSMEGHTSWVNDVAFNPDNNSALSVGYGSRVILWDLETGQEIRRFDGHFGPVMAVEFNPDGLSAITGGFSGYDRRNPGELILWDIESGLEIRRCSGGHRDAIMDVVISPDGRYALASSGANADSLTLSEGGHAEVARLWNNYGEGEEFDLILWDLEKCEILQRYKTENHDNFSLAISADGNWALAGSTDHNLYLWDLHSGEQISRLEGHRNPVISVVISEDGAKALSADAYSHQLILWDLKMMEPINFFKIHEFIEVTLNDMDIAISPDGRYALSSSTDGTLVHWDLIDKRELQRFTGNSDTITDVVFTADGQYLLTSSGRSDPGMMVTEENSIRLWDIQSGEIVHIYTGHTDGVTSIAVSPDNQYLLSGSIDQSVRLWDIQSGEEIQNLQGHGTYVTDVAFSSDGQRGLSSSFLGTLLLWDLDAGRFTHSFPSTGEIFSLAVSPEGEKVLAGGSGESPIFIWDLETGFEINRFWGHMGKDLNISGIVIDPNGQFALTGDSYGTLIQWDIETGEELHRFTEHHHSIMDISIDADGANAVSCDEGGTLVIWDLKDSKSIGQFQPSYEGTMYACEISPDGNSVAFSIDDTVYIWRLDIPTLDEIMDWIIENRHVRELTCEERDLYRIGACEE